MQRLKLHCGDFLIVLCFGDDRSLLRVIIFSLQENHGSRFFGDYAGLFEMIILVFASLLFVWWNPVKGEEKEIFMLAFLLNIWVFMGRGVVATCDVLISSFWCMIFF